MRGCTHGEVTCGYRAGFSLTGCDAWDSKSMRVCCDFIGNLDERSAAVSEWSQCFYCGLHLKFKDRTVDHVHPRTLGGEKLVTSCRGCNNKKGDMSLDDFREFMGCEKFYGELRGWEPW